MYASLFFIAQNPTALIPARGGERLLSLVCSASVLSSSCVPVFSVAFTVVSCGGSLFVFCDSLSSGVPSSSSLSLSVGAVVLDSCCVCAVCLEYGVALLGSAVFVLSLPLGGAVIGSRLLECFLL